MKFPSTYRKFAAFLLFFFVVCASPKKEIGDAELKLVLDYLAEVRFGERLSAVSEKPIQTDKQIFLAACERYSLDSSALFKALEEKHPSIYSRLVKEE
ncbi:hypothetical protein EHO61_15170 [Leptospira fluminis]|uniref:Lipoprotein n=2 Tax=Leptospira TaxID=171 RepID=A0A4V3JE96_9LEPT|nr:MULTISPECIES: hypothetical protein [Leptospira]TGK06399.1 hypothetical protein EHO60_15280 [Leptospira fletcheri]TGK15691.1 hypothetical protein EHO61_15170 [Leptospira fluminis]